MAQQAAPSLPADIDPLNKVLALGEREVRSGAILGFVLALVMHGAAGAQAATNLYEMQSFARAVKGYVKSSLQLQIEIDEAPPPPPPPPAAEPPPPEAEPEQAAPPPSPAPPPPAAANEPPPPPAPAEAGQVLTSEPDPNEPVDLTGDSIVTGEGEYRGGITSSTGTAKTAVRDVNAQPGGVPGGTGTTPAPPRAPEKDLSRPATPPKGGSWGDCPYPAEAQLDGIEYGVVQLAVTVGIDGRPKSVTVLKDPGSGFGAQARQCAMRKVFGTALDKSGQPVVGTTAPFTVRFYIP